MVALKILIVPIAIITGYSLLNAGNPDSLLRPFVPDPAYDVYVAMALSVLVFILCFIVFYSQDRHAFRHLVEVNGAKIRELRKDGKSDAEIADSILTALGSRSGYKHRLARKKLLVYLSEFV